MCASHIAGMDENSRSGSRWEPGANEHQTEILDAGQATDVRAAAPEPTSNKARTITIAAGLVLVGGLLGAAFGNALANDNTVPASSTIQQQDGTGQFGGQGRFEGGPGGHGRGGHGPGEGFGRGHGDGFRGDGDSDGMGQGNPYGYEDGTGSAGDT